MIRFSFVTLLGLLHVSPFGFAQLTETDTMKLNALMSMNGNFSAGNVDRILIFTRGETVLSATNRAWVFKTQNSYRYGTVKSNETENDLTLVDYVYHQPFKTVYPFIMASYENSLLKKIRHRVGGGIGVTVVPLRNKTSLLKFSVTAYVDRSVYDSETNEGAYRRSQFVNTIRPTIRIFERHQLKESISFFYEFIDQISVSKSGNHRLIGSAGFKYGYSEMVEVSSSVNYSHEDLTAEDVEPNDVFLTVGINVRYKK